MSDVRVALTLAPLVLLTACASGPPSLELGTGLDAFGSIEDGQDLPMIEGAQGGWHLWIAAHAESIDPEGARFSVLAYPEAAGRPRQTTAVTGHFRPSGTGYDLTGLAAVFSAPECYQDQRTVLEATLTDGSGLVLTDRRVVVPRWPEPIGTCE